MASMKVSKRHTLPDSLIFSSPGRHVNHTEYDVLGCMSGYTTKHIKREENTSLA